MKKKPVIGVLSAMHQLELVIPLYFTTSHYLEEIKSAGGIPIQIPVMENVSDEDLTQFISLCDGFLLPGGGDFSPEWYGETLLDNLDPNSIELSREVQDTALRFIRLASQSNKPVLGICLGAQLLNIAFGGSLYQDIPTQFPSGLTHSANCDLIEERWDTVHQVILQPDSKLSRITRQSSFRVNSFHHQAVKDVAPGFEITARSEDGLPEAIEHTEKDLIGVQWHPENLAHADFPEAKALFRWLIETAR